MPIGLRVRATPAGGDPIKGYLERLVKLIPSEVVGLYLAGKGAIQTKFPSPQPDPAEAPYWLWWTVFCGVAVFLVRVWATREPGKDPQWAAAGISVISFLIWIYSMGDVFVRALTRVEWDPLLGTLLVLGWTFVVPLFYKGDESTKPSTEGS